MTEPHPANTPSAKKIPLVEIFGPTIQGEGSVIGYQTIFLRLGGCDYRCERCDSLHAVLPQLFRNDESTQYLTIEEMTEVTRDFIGHCEWITLSGGNPCMWDLTYMLEELNLKPFQEGREVKFFALETQGTLWKDWIRLCTKITVSPKGPGMGEKFEPQKFDVFVQNLYPEDVYSRHPGFSLKVVVFDQRDIEFLVEILDRYPWLKPVTFISIGNIYPPAPARRGAGSSVEDLVVTQSILVDQVLSSYLVIADEVMQDPRLSSVRVLPQLHTLLWGNDKGR